MKIRPSYDYFVFFFIICVVFSFQNCGNNKFVATNFNVTSFSSESGATENFFRTIELNNGVDFSNEASSTGALAVNLVWNGPITRIVFKDGTPSLLVNGNKLNPVFLSVNTQAIQTDSEYDKLLYQIDQSIKYGIPVIDLMLANKSIPFLKKLNEKLGKRQIYLWIRFDLCIPENAQVEPTVFMNNHNEVVSNARTVHCLDDSGTNWIETPYYLSMTYKWIHFQSESLKRLIKNLTVSGLSSKVIGFRPMSLEGGEWFQPPVTSKNGVLANSDEAGLFPWLSPANFYAQNFSLSEREMFNDWLRYRNEEVVHEMPSYSEQTKAKLGTAFVVGNKKDKNIMLYNQFKSERISSILIRLAEIVKAETNYSSLYSVFAGYLFSIAHFNAANHTALSMLIDSKFVDAISAPYNYNTVQGSRTAGQALIPHGPFDSVALHQKLFLYEDDSRPYWYQDGFNATSDFNQDKAILLRNGLTALLHNQGIYFFDLSNKGWFGNSDRQSEGNELWDLISSLYRQNNAIQNSKSEVIKPEVAVFVDEKSFHLHPLFGIGKNTYESTQNSFIGQISRLARLGFPIRYYLQSELEKPDLDLRFVKVAFFVNSYILTTEQRRQIEYKLKNNNRTLFFLYAAGLYDEAIIPNMSLMNSLLETNLSVTIDETTTLSMTAYGEIGGDYVVSPTFFGPLDNSYARFKKPFADGLQRGSMYKISKNNYSIIYSNQGINNDVFLAELMRQAGVFFYSNDGLIIDGAKNYLMIHGNKKGLFQINLPQKFKSVKKNTLNNKDGVQQLCQDCSTLNISLNGASTYLLELIND